MQSFVSNASPDAMEKKQAQLCAKELMDTSLTLGLKTKTKQYQRISVSQDILLQVSK